MGTFSPSLEMQSLWELIEHTAYYTGLGWVIELVSLSLSLLPFSTSAYACAWYRH